MHNAIATNKLSSATGTAISTARLCKNKFVDWGVALPCISMALVGSFAGAHIALLASDKILKWMLIPVLPIVAFYVMKKKNLDDNSNVEISRKKQWILCAVCSLAVGCYDGFYGPGTGTFLLILYTGVAKLPVAKASGTMKLANLSSNIMALVVFLFSGKIVIYLGLAASVFSIAGHYVGSGMVMKNGNKIVRPIILIVLVILVVLIVLVILVVLIVLVVLIPIEQFFRVGVVELGLHIAGVQLQRIFVSLEGFLQLALLEQRVSLIEKCLSGFLAPGRVGCQLLRGGGGELARLVVTFLLIERIGQIERRLGRVGRLLQSPSIGRFGLGIGPLLVLPVARADRAALGIFLSRSRAAEDEQQYGQNRSSYHGFSSSCFCTGSSSAGVCSTSVSLVCSTK